MRPELCRTLFGRTNENPPSRFLMELPGEGIEFRGPDLGVENSVYLRDPDGLQIEICTAPLMDTEFD